MYGKLLPPRGHKQFWQLKRVQINVKDEAQIVTLATYRVSRMATKLLHKLQKMPRDWKESGGGDFFFCTTRGGGGGVPKKWIGGSSNVP